MIVSIYGNLYSMWLYKRLPPYKHRLSNFLAEASLNLIHVLNAGCLTKVLALEILEILHLAD